MGRLLPPPLPLPDSQNTGLPGCVAAAAAATVQRLGTDAPAQMPGTHVAAPAAECLGVQITVALLYALRRASEHHAPTAGRDALHRPRPGLLPPDCPAVILMTSPNPSPPSQLPGALASCPLCALRAWRTCSQGRATCQRRMCITGWTHAADSFRHHPSPRMLMVNNRHQTGPEAHPVPSAPSSLSSPRF